MANEVKKVSSFAKQVLAHLKGDGNEVLAQKIARKALNAYQSQVAALKSAEIDAELNLEDAVEKLDAAKFPTAMITDGQMYCQNVINAQGRVADATDELADVRDSIETFEALIKEF